MPPHGADPRAEILSGVRKAIVSDDPLVAWYLDLRRHRVIYLRGDRVSVPDLTVADVEEDEERFVEIPVVTTSEEYTWMVEFVETRDDPRLLRHLDARKGAQKRFAKALLTEEAAHLPAWEAHRAAQVAALAAEWLDDVLSD